MTQYKPISCDFYDQFEIASMRKLWVKLDMHSKQSLYTKIKTLTTREKSEYGCLLDNSEIRLDQVKSLEVIDKDYGLIGFMLDKVDYNLRANRKVVEVIMMSEEKDENGLIMSHIINAMDIWSKRMLGESDHFGVWQNHSQEEWDILLEATYLDTIRAINMNSIGHVIHFKNTEGAKFELKMEDILYHMINHSTYHRGQIILNLQKDQEKTVSTDYFRHVLFW